MSGSPQPSAGSSIRELLRKPRSKPEWVLVGALAVVVVLVLLILFGGIPGLSLNVSNGSSSTNHTITFYQTGLATGVEWTVQLTQNTTLVTSSSAGASLTFSEPNGLYLYTVLNVAGYSVLPQTGEITVSNNDVTVSLAFSHSTTPIGVDFSWGIPINATGVTNPGCPVATGHYCYSIEIAGAGGGISTANVLLALRNAVGATVAWPTGITVSLFSPTNATAVATYNTVNQSWTLNPPYGGLLSGGFTLVFYTAGTGAGNGLLGLQVVAIGTNGFSGTAPSNSFS
ncbi:MAG TPA: hypothetical protein VEH28_02975 [Thermoplasmata archaeon]|nr:hypothetical protein [Thermoplasmata archaeon]